MKNIRITLYLIIVFLVFGISAKANTTSDSSRYKIKLDLSRFIYTYSALELSFEKELSHKIGFVVDANAYLGLQSPKEKDVLSAIKANTSFGNFRISSGINYYLNQARNLYVRTRVSYGYVKVKFSRYVCLASNEPNYDEICECYEYNKDELTKNMHQLMGRIGFGYDYRGNNNIILSAYSDLGLVKYISNEIGIIREDNACNSLRITKELLEFTTNEIYYSDGALAKDQNNPILLLQFGLKIGYVF